MNSIKFIKGEMTQTKFRIQSLEVQIRKEKMKLSDSHMTHDHLWMLRDRLRYELNILKMYKDDLKRKEFVMKQYNKNQSNDSQVMDTSHMTTMEVLGMNHPEFKSMDNFFKMIKG